MKKIFKAELTHITHFIFDVDGVMTDGTVSIDANGELIRTMNVKDGYALKTALNHGYGIAIITGGTNQGVKDRLQALGIRDIFLGAHDKDRVLEEYLEDYDIDPKHCLYMGDDLPDLTAMKRCHLATCPQDAVPEIKAQVDYISHLAGGKGCVRDVIEQVLKVNGHWNHDSETTSA